jgi:hypothetical protein
MDLESFVSGLKSGTRLPEGGMFYQGIYFSPEGVFYRGMYYSPEQWKEREEIIKYREKQANCIKWSRISDVFEIHIKGVEGISTLLAYQNYRNEHGAENDLTRQFAKDYDLDLKAYEPSDEEIIQWLGDIYSEEEAKEKIIPILPYHVPSNEESSGSEPSGTGTPEVGSPGLGCLILMLIIAAIIWITWITWITFSGKQASGENAMIKTKIEQAEKVATKRYDAEWGHVISLWVNSAQATDLMNNRVSQIGAYKGSNGSQPEEYDFLTTINLNEFNIRQSTETNRFVISPRCATASEHSLAKR